MRSIQRKSLLPGVLRISLFSASSITTVACLCLLDPIQFDLETSNIQLLLIFFFSAQILVDFLLSEYVLGFKEQQGNRWLSAPIGIITAGFAYSIIQLSMGLL